jgi:hypothetical protein
MSLGTRRAAQGAAILLSVAAAAAAGAQASRPAAMPVLGRLQNGLWELRSLEGNGRFAPVCLGDRDALVQLQHRRAACARTIVAQAQDRLEVAYNCPSGFGQTTIRVETPRLARIESEGVDNGVPFGFRLEARRVGPC